MILEEVNDVCSGCAYFHIKGDTFEEKKLVCDKGKFSIPLMLICDAREEKE